MRQVGSPQVFIEEPLASFGDCCRLNALPDAKPTTSNDDARLTTIFQDNLGKPVPQTVSSLDFIGAKGDGGGDDNWSYKTCKTPVKSSPPTHKHPTFYRPDAFPVAQPTVPNH